MPGGWPIPWADTHREDQGWGEFGTDGTFCLTAGPTSEKMANGTSGDPRQYDAYGGSACPSLRRAFRESFLRSGSASIDDTTVGAHHVRPAVVLLGQGGEKDPHLCP